MLKNRIGTAFAFAAMVGLAACGGGEENADVVTEEVVTTPEVEQVEVPVMTQDTAVVRTEMDVDVDTDTVDVGT